MKNGCDICLPNHKGYTLWFEKGQTIEALIPYFAPYPDQQWKILDEQTVWAGETVVFDLLDYLEAHFDAAAILAVETPKTDPWNQQKEKQPLLSLRTGQQASWVDAIIDESRIRTHYQPIVQVTPQTTTILGHELLSRGVNEEGGLVSPFQLFEAARARHKLFALDRVCRMQAVKNAAGLTDQLIFINFIPTAIYVPEHCLATTFALIQEIGVQPEQVVFEVVESDEVDDIEHLKNILHYYRDHGFKYALDDVGTGANDLKKLASLEPHFVKLAREYVDGVRDDPAKQQVARSVLQIAHQLHSQPLAEGVEHQEDLAYLTALGYELFQGYYFGRPQEKPLHRLTGQGDVTA